MSQVNRVETMAEKLGVYAARAGATDVEKIIRAYHLALRPRLANLPDVFHHDMLHPARTALILIEDVHCHDAVILASALLTETRDPILRVAREQIAEVMGQHVADMAAAVPDPVADAETLVEDLVSAERDVALIALAERLDHARHLHMRAPDQWRDYFHQTITVYLPVAERIQPTLLRRFERWAGAFEKRLH